MITPCFPEDAELIEALASKIWRQVYPGIISSEQIEFMLNWMYSPEKIRDDMAFGIAYFWIENESERIGYAAFGPDRDDEGIWLHKIYLAPEFQRRGIGTAVLKQIFSMSRDVPLHLRVNRHNTHAISAYLSNGFEVFEERCSEIGGGFVMDDLIMKRSPKEKGVIAT